MPEQLTTGLKVGDFALYEYQGEIGVVEILEIRTYDSYTYGNVRCCSIHSGKEKFVWGVWLTPIPEAIPLVETKIKLLTGLLDDLKRKAGK